MAGDLFGFAPPASEFKDIRNQKEAVAEEKAALCLELNKLCKTPPRSLGAASINSVRQWRATHASALKTLNAKDSSRQQLHAAINSLRAFE